MPIEICEEFAERLAKREEELAERAAEFPFVSTFATRKWGDAPASPVHFLRYGRRDTLRAPAAQE